MTRKYNFNPGPATLPLEVLEKMQKELLDYQGSGMSILETSHRSPEFKKVLESTKQNLAEIMELPDGYEILFLGGGASTQFAMIAMNFLDDGQTADYVNTGAWSTKAIKEAKLFGNVNVAASSEEEKFGKIPSNFYFTQQAAYVHVTSNNTIFGTQWKNYPDVGDVPLIVDMSSDVMSRKVDMRKFSLIYAGAQKNVGPAGATMVIIKKELLDKAASRSIPTMLNYKTHIDKDSMFNTPPVFAIYVIGLVAEWIKNKGGLEKIEDINNKKAELLYATIDSMPDFYRGTAEKASRSYMNATFRLPSEALEKEFIAKTAEKNFHGLKGHRSVGGIRVSMYNALPLEGVEKLCEFMKKFPKS